MRTIKTTVYLYDELDEKAQAKVREEWMDVSLAYDWRNNIYEDAERIGLKISECNIDHGSYLLGVWAQTPMEVAQAIVENHSEICKTYKLARTFLDVVKDLPENDSEEAFIPDFHIPENKREELEEEFSKSIKQAYLDILRDEYEYLTSDEQVAEAIRANGYAFTADGEII